MEILKYLDVIIGLAVVMLLLSPLVSAFTQIWLWFTNTRSGRLQVGLTNLILELNGSSYEQFDAAEITGLPRGAPVTFAQPAAQPAIVTNADDAGSLVLTQNIPAMLTAHGGDLRPALTLPAGAPPTVRLRPRGSSAGRPNPLPAPASLAATEAEKIAGTVLLHPMIAQPTFLKIFRSRKGEVVQREELIRLLLGYAANPTTIPGVPRPDPVLLAAMQNLRQILAENDVPDPGRSLCGIRDAAQRLELTDFAAAAHNRLTKAILETSQSAFVGRINIWFDQIMDRTTAEYKFRAQLVTVLGALMVATMIQLDSINLLRRLSTNDKLRESLVQQAEIQQKRYEDQQKAVVPNQNELEAAKARRDEIESNLTGLRDPQLAVLPDHFIWQPLPRARLTRNPAWQFPYAPRLELSVGGSVYPLQPLWTPSGDPLAAIESAIRNSAAPVKTAMAPRGANIDLVVTSRNQGALQLRSAPGKPETNMFNAAPEWSCNGPVCFDYDLFAQSWRGVLLTWVLLSLGAPFWYDAVKDALKLRSTVAKKEEDTRIDRQTGSSAKASTS